MFRREAFTARPPFGLFLRPPRQADYHAWLRQLSCPRPLPPPLFVAGGYLHASFREPRGGSEKRGQIPAPDVFHPLSLLPPFAFFCLARAAPICSSFPPAKCLRRPARLSSGGDALRSQGHTGRNERGDCRLGRGGRSGAGGPWSALPLPLSVACAVHDGTQTAGTFLRSRFAVARVPSARGPRRWRFSWCSQLFRWLILTDFSSCWCCRLRFGRMCWCLVRRARIPCFDRGGFSPALLRSIRARWPGLFASATFVRLPAVRPCPESLVLNTFCVPGG